MTPAEQPHNSPRDEQALAEALAALAERERPDAVFVDDLEATLRRHAASRASTRLGGASGRRWLLPRHARRLVAGAIVIVLLLALATPPSRAALRNWLGNLAFTEAPITTPVPVLTVDVPPDTRPLSLDEVRRRAPFAVPVPTALPAGVALAGGSVVEHADGVQVALVWRPPDSVGQLDGPFLLLTIDLGVPLAPPLLSDEQRGTVVVGGQSALYAAGNWRANSATGDEERLTDLTWDASIDTRWLTWEADGLRYLLVGDGLGLSRRELIAIGESLEE